MITNNKTSIVLGCFSAALLSFCTPVAQSNYSNFVDSNGNIGLPDDFRNSMVHLGSWFVPSGGASGFHDVYTEQETVVAYRDTGEFPDGATLVKELRASHFGDYSTGAGVNYASDELKQWFVMIKDTQGRFSGNALWGDGWGWALFMPGDTTSNVATDYKADCLGCHVPARENDWIYVEAYPTLRNQ
ncbi:MAG: hypothetical protein ACI95C_001099 [Pseudohongiellaceae bacterium]|jgi:hypothetical protein